MITIGIPALDRKLAYERRKSKQQQQAVFYQITFLSLVFCIATLPYFVAVICFFLLQSGKVIDSESEYSEQSESEEENKSESDLQILSNAFASGISLLCYLLLMES